MREFYKNVLIWWNIMVSELSSWTIFSTRLPSKLEVRHQSVPMVSPLSPLFLNPRKPVLHKVKAVFETVDQKYNRHCHINIFGSKWNCFFQQSADILRVIHAFGNSVFGVALDYKLSIACKTLLGSSGFHFSSIFNDPTNHLVD